jgi:hypothetical protein
LVKKLPPPPPPPPTPHTVCLFHLYQAEMYVVAKKKKEFHIQRRKKIGRPCFCYLITFSVFFWVKFCTVATKTRIQCKV